VEDLDLEALELAVRQQALQLAGAAVEQRLNADTSDEQGSRIRCGCGQEARLVGRRSKQVQSVLGPLQLERAYLSLLLLRPRLLSSRRAPGYRKYLALSSPCAHGRRRGCHGQLTELAGVAVDAKRWKQRQKRWDKDIAEGE